MRIFFNWMEDERNWPWYKHFVYYHWDGFLTVFIPCVFSFLLFMEPRKAYQTAFIVLVVIFYWIAEPIPLSISSLIPMAALPLFGVLTFVEAVEAFFTDHLMVYLANLIATLAVEYSRLHQRIGLKCIILIGCSPYRLFFALTMLTALISMWMPNLAAAAIIFPVVKAVLSELETEELIIITTDEPHLEDEIPFATPIVVCFYMGVAYAAGIGGIGTMLGTAPNLSWKSIYDRNFPKNMDTRYTQFSLMGLPTMLCIFASLFLIFCIKFMGLWRPNSEKAKEINTTKETTKIVEDLIKEKYEELGPITMHELQVAILFILMIILLITRQPGAFEGFADVLNDTSIKESCCIALIVILLFALPADYNSCGYFICRAEEDDPDRKRNALLSWNFTKRNMPWYLIFLIGGGFVLASGSAKSGLSRMIGDGFALFMRQLPPPLIQLSCILSSMFVTEFVNNTTAVNLLVPVFMELAVDLKIHPVYLTLPTTFSVSMAFLLPISTPVNYLVLKYAHIRTSAMIMNGIWISAAAAFWIFFFFQTLSYAVFPELGGFPNYAKQNVTSAYISL